MVPITVEMKLAVKRAEMDEDGKQTGNKTQLRVATGNETREGSGERAM